MDHKKASLLDHREVAKFLETDLKCGLGQLEAWTRLKRFGRNKLNHQGVGLGPDEDQQNVIQNCLRGQTVKFLRQLLNPLIQLLLICALVSGAIGQYENAISVLVSILIVCTISYLQERRADKSLEKLQRQMPATCQVIRDGQTLEIETELLVPGDLVHLCEGQRVPADIRLFELYSLTIDESNLTGETQSQCKQIRPPTAASTGGSFVEPNPTASTQRMLAIDIDRTQGPAGELPLIQQQENARIINKNLALMGTVVESGHSYGLVFATGKATRYGQVFNMLKSAQHPKSPLQANIDQLSVHLVVIACFIIALTSIVGIVQQRTTLEVAYYAISLAVTAIPEGLPVVVAVIMALGVIRLSRQKTIVKSLNSIETLGCIQVLCSDKTGTLTRNDMTLTDIVTSDLHSLSSQELEELNKEECMKHMTFNKFGGKMYSLSRLMEVGTLCNNAQLDHSFAKPAAASQPRVTHPDDSSIADDSELSDVTQSTSSSSGSTGDGVSFAQALEERRFVGQATECAILEAALRLGFGDSRTKFERLEETPFSSTTRRMVVKCRRRDLHPSGPTYYVKGAWEEILKECSHYYENGLVKARQEDTWREYERVCTALGSQGLQVLALAMGPTLDELTFVGLVGISNSLRDGMIETVGKLRDKFHIDVKMITGDSQATAVAVGRSLGLLGPLEVGRLASKLQHQQQQPIMDKRLMSGEELQRLLSANLDPKVQAREILAKNVFYRVDPIQKANIVSKLQELNMVVGMTGDGVNDIISLKRANLSLVMGSGADVCKEIADVIMVEDDLSVLLNAVLEGKAIYHKIHNFMAYQISISLAIVVLITLAFGLRSDTPFSVIQLLYINILADGPPAQSLAMERLSENELSMWPRNVNDRLLSCRLLGTLTVLTTTLLALNGALYDFLLDSSGHLDGHARALLFANFVFCTTFATLSLRSKFKTVLESRPAGNKELMCCCALVISLQVAVTQINGLNKFFQVERVPWIELLYVFLYSSIVLIVMDGVKLIVRLLHYSHKLLLKLAHNFQIPASSFSTRRRQSYSTTSSVLATTTTAASRKHNGRLTSNSDYLAAVRPGAAQCMAVTPLAAPRTIFGNLMPTTPKINITGASIQSVDEELPAAPRVAREPPPVGCDEKLPAKPAKP